MFACLFLICAVLLSFFSLFLGGCWWCLLRSLVWWFVDVFFGIYAGLCYYFAGGFASVLVCLLVWCFVDTTLCVFVGVFVCACV